MKNRKSNFALLALAFTLFIAPAEAAKKPAWVDGGAAASYPSSAYLTGVGMGKDMERARSSARAEIAKIFQSRIEQTTRETQSESFASEGRSGKTGFSARNDIENETMVFTQGLLEGVTVPETWFDKKKKLYYAIAVLNKSKMRAGLAQERAEKEALFTQALGEGRNASSALEKARAFGKALRLKEELDILRSRERIVGDVAVADPEMDESARTLRHDREKALGALGVFLETGEEPGKSPLREAVAAAITDMGFTLVASTHPRPSSPESIISISSRLTLQPLDRGNPSWFFTQWNGFFDIRDKDGRTITTAANQGQESGLTAQAAEVKARQAGAKAVAEKTREQLTRYLDGQP